MNTSSEITLDRSTIEQPAPKRTSTLRGIHHLALNTDDLKSTLDFYVKILGMPLIGGLMTGPGGAETAKTRGNPPFAHIPHYFLDMGGDSILAFFEYPKGKVGKCDRDTIAAMQHVSFACSPRRYRELERRLREHDVTITFGPQVLVEPNIQSMYFFDPNGIRLEVTADMNGDPEDLNVVTSFTLTREAMRRELKTVSTDENWIEEMLEHMPEPNPKSDRDRYHGA